VEVLDLYRCDRGKPLQPALTEEERARYFTGTPPSQYPDPSPDIAPIVEKLRSADALVFVYPTWWMSVPAILKGLFDRALLPGVTFRLPTTGEKTSPLNGLVPGLQNVKKVATVTTYGSPWYFVALASDCGRALIGRALLPLFSNDCTILWKGLYSLDSVSERDRSRFLEEVEQTFSMWLPPSRKAS